MRPDNNVALENKRSRVDVRPKVVGAAKFAADQYPRGILFAQFIRFPFGAGRIKSADLDAARATAGVLEIELDTKKNYAYPGDRMGQVVGESPDAIDDAIAALNLKYYLDTPRTDPQRDYSGPPEPDAEQVQQLDTIFKSAAAVVEATYTTQVQTHSSLETHGGVVDHRGDSAEAWGSSQGTFAYLNGLANPTGLDASKILVHCEYVGGGFGAKFDPGPEGTLAARTSKKYKRPCRYMLDRREEHLDTGNRPGSIQYMKIAVAKDGAILGGRIHCASVVGFQPGGGGVKNPALYEFHDVVRTEEDLVLNSGRPRAFRAPGWPQAVFAVESMMDELAAAVSMDPIAFRKKNETSDRRRSQLDRAAELIGWNRRKPDGSGAGRVKTGFGVGGAMWPTWPTECQAEVDIYRNGKVEVRSGVQDIGTGTFTVVTDVAADQLQIDRDRITGKVGLSSYPEGPASGGSVTARSVAPAVRDAAKQALDGLIAAVAREWRIDSTKVEYKKSVFSEKGGSRTLSWEKACPLMTSEKISARGKLREEYKGKGTSDGVQIAEVEVDTETGIVRVKKIVVVQACGTPVNRLTAENQICGGTIQGISFALFEDRILNAATGAMVNPNLEFYKIAGPVDVPEIVPVLDRRDEDTGVYPLGEPATIPTAGAIANAVANAIGVRVRSLPITPRRVLEALERKGKQI